MSGSLIILCRVHFEKEHPDPNTSQDCPLDHFSDSETDDLELAIMLSSQDNFKNLSMQASIKESPESHPEPVFKSPRAAEDAIGSQPSDAPSLDEDTDWKEDEDMTYSCSWFNWHARR